MDELGTPSQASVDDNGHENITEHEAQEENTQTQEPGAAIIAPHRSSRKHTASPLEWEQVPLAMEGHIPPATMLAQAYVAAQDVGEPASYKEALSSPDSEKWKQAIQSEYDSLIENDTWVLEDLPPGRTPISCKWVFKRKLNPDGSAARFKARLVVRGFPEGRH